MQKRNLIFGIFLMFFVFNLIIVSASYNYNSFSIGEFFDSIDDSTIVLSVIFIVCFAVLNYALVRAFRGNKATAGVVAFAIALLITWGANKAGIDFTEILYGIGISSDILAIVLPILFLIVFFFLGKKFGFGASLLILGVLLLAVSIFTDLIYEDGIATIIGIIIVLIGIFLIRRKKKINYGYSNFPGYRKPGFFSRGASAVGRGAWGATKWTGGKIKSRYGDWRDNQRQKDEATNKYIVERDRKARGRYETEKERLRYETKRERELKEIQKREREHQEALEENQRRNIEKSEADKQWKRAREEEKKREEEARKQQENLKKYEEREFNRIKREKEHLKEQLKAYRKQMESICKSIGGHIPKKGTPEYVQWKQLYDATKDIEKRI